MAARTQRGWVRVERRQKWAGGVDGHQKGRGRPPKASVNPAGIMNFGVLIGY